VQPLIRFEITRIAVDFFGCNSDYFQSHFYVKGKTGMAQSVHRRAGQPGFDSWQGQYTFLYSTASRPALGPTQPPIQWVSGALPPGLKPPGRDADQSPPFSAEVKNDGGIPPLPQAFSWRGA
jgi:hypothetical protein